jgi:hypothetical protein
MPTLFACDLLEDNFHQITRLSGSVVGVAKSDPRHNVKSIRQSVPVKKAKLELFSYSTTQTKIWERKPLFTKFSDDKGIFDFGQIPDGRYTLLISTEWNDDEYAVEITQKVHKSDLIKIDISPVNPDCTGGHEFLINQK